MALALVWSDEAEEEFKDIIAYLLDEWGDESARRFSDRLDKKLTSLGSMPNMGKRHSRLKAVRSLPMPPFYTLYYSVVREQHIHILNLVDERKA
ncbi:MAG: type II toxin-antitoxin system RelE/ParE family toxin [Sphingobacteriaceae bacterium]|nr:type II toxin-antitoxin system RelE/ParE family toxin [Cytophagaceae bacterium]